jgi:hypothetical protein
MAPAFAVLPSMGKRIELTGRRPLRLPGGAEGTWSTGPSTLMSVACTHCCEHYRALSLHVSVDSADKKPSAVDKTEHQLCTWLISLVQPLV